MTALRSLALALLAVITAVAACTSSPPAPPPSSARPTVVPDTPASSATSGAASPSEPSAPAPSGPQPSGSTQGAVPTIKLSALANATVPTTFVLLNDTRAITESKVFLTTSDKTFLGRAKTAPFETTVSVPPGRNTVEVRSDLASGGRSEVEVSFVAKAGRLQAANTTPPGPAASIAPTTPTVTVSSATELADALRHATPGAVIRLSDGVYTNTRGARWHLAASGTAAQPITLEGDRAAVLQSDSTSGDYGLWITGSYWHVLGITVRNAAKGIVLDNSQHTVIDGVEVYDIGDEGVHFRTCSSWGVLQNSSVHDTGLVAPSYGEGVYVGSAHSNWSKYGCSDGQDRTEDVIIRGNHFRHIAAEGADLKEGTTSGWLLDNVFDDAGYSGQNSADSAVDVKGNNWVIAGNTALNPQGADQDAFQTHAVEDGYGTGNVFSANTVQGAWPGFGFGLYPALANIVLCNNTAPDAKGGLVGADNKPLRCAS